MNAVAADLFSGIARSTATMDGDIVCSDALELLSPLEAGSVACIVTDPPYGIAYHSNHYKDKNPHAPIAHDWNCQIGAYLNAAARVLQDGGALYLFTRWDVFPLWAKEVPAPLVLKNAIVWCKDNWSSGDLTGNFGFQYEMIMFMTKGRHTIRGKRWPNVWEFPRIPAKQLRMPAEKPVGLFERAICASSDPGDLIVDTFCGSGTAAEAAIRSNRRFLVGDVDRGMVSMSRRRVGMEAIEDDEHFRHSVSMCPVFSVTPPSPALWGVHPEDIAEWRTP